MKPFLQDTNRRMMFEKWLDALSLFAVLQYAAFRFLQSTMFTFYFSNTYKTVTMILLLVFGGIRYLYLIVSKWRICKDQKCLRLFVIQHGFFLCLALPFFYVGWRFDYKFLIFLPFCCLCLYDMEAKKILKSFIFTIGTLLLSTILCCLSGTVRNLVKTLDDGRVVGAYGIINSTDFASYFTFLLLAIWCMIRNHDVSTNILFGLFEIVVSFVVYRYTDSKTALITGGILALCILWNTIEENVLQRKKRLYPFRKIVQWLSTLAFPIVGLIVLYLTFRFGQNDSFVTQLDGGILDGRLAATWIPYETYGIHPFGTLIESMHGKGGTVIPNWSTGYGYIDVAYSMLVIRYGWVITGIIVGLWIWMTIKAFKNGNNRIALTMMILALHGFSEARILDVNYNIFLIMPFCALDKTWKTQEKGSVHKKKRTWISVVTGLLILGIVWISLPNFLSILRTYFSGNGWNRGSSAFHSLIISVGIILFVFGVYIILVSTIEHRNRKRITAFIGIISFGVFCFFLIYHSISIMMKEQEKRLAAEESVIKEVESIASLPVYAAEPSEFYLRRFGGISNHIFSTEELNRYPKGSIFTDVDTESLGIISQGGLFSEISEWTGLYSYDQNVIDSLARKGYEWTPYYSGEHKLCLSDAAVFSGIKVDNKIELSQGQRLVTPDMIDQYAGRYEVTFSLSGFSGSGEEPVVILEVLGEAGESQLAKMDLYADDFDQTGCCNKTIDYIINSTPKVSYAVSAEAGVHLSIENISWKRLFQTQTNGIILREDGTLFMRTTIPDNYFNLIHFQLFEATTGRYLLEFGSGNTEGNISGEYIHQLESGLYCLRFKGNTNLSDEWIQTMIYIENGSVIHFAYHIDELTDDHIQISNLLVEKDMRIINLLY